MVCDYFSCYNVKKILIDCFSIAFKTISILSKVSPYRVDFFHLIHAHTRKETISKSFFRFCTCNLIFALCLASLLLIFVFFFVCLFVCLFVLRSISMNFLVSTTVVYGKQILNIMEKLQYCLY